MKMASKILLHQVTLKQATRCHRRRRRRRPPGPRAGGGQRAVETIQGILGSEVIHHPARRPSPWELCLMLFWSHLNMHRIFQVSLWQHLSLIPRVGVSFYTRIVLSMPLTLDGITCLFAWYSPNQETKDNPVPVKKLAIMCIFMHYLIYRARNVIKELKTIW